MASPGTTPRPGTSSTNDNKPPRISPPRLSPPLVDNTPTDDMSGEDGIYNDDAQFLMQPALSAAATHLTLPKTPAAEKAAALDTLPEAPFFDPVATNGETEISSDSDDAASTPRHDKHEFDHHDGETRRRREGGAADPEGLSQTPTTFAPIRPAIEQTKQSPSPPTSQKPSVLPSPWRSSDVDPLASTTGRDEWTKRALDSLSFGQNRQKRSGSTGAETLKRLSKALPSLPNPSHLFSSVSSSFFSQSPDKSSSPSSSGPGFVRSATELPRYDSHTSSTHSGRSSTGRMASPPQAGDSNNSNTTTTSGTGTAPRRLHSRTISHTSTSSGTVVDPPQRPMPIPIPNAGSRAGTPRTSLTKARSIRRTTSDDSLLYHSLSRVSSFGDDDKFEHVREMANVRMKAIKDSLPDRPSFKMPSLPKFNAQRKMFMSPEDQGIPPIPEAPASDPEGDALDKVLKNLTGDLVILGGYRGSVLRSAEAPHQQLWAPVKVGLNMRKADLEVGLDVEDEETMEKRIIPSGMLQNIGPIDISRRFFKKVRSCENARHGKLRVWDYGYDWRLSPHRLSKRMETFLEGLPSNQTSTSTREPRGALVIAHSLGGVITRHVVNQRPELFSGVVYVGVPQRCINILGPIRNGDNVLLNEKILTAHVNFSLRTSFVFLPEDGFCFIDKETKEPYPIDFHDADEWVKYRLSPSVASTLPALNPKPPSGFGSILRSRSISISERWGQSSSPTSSSTTIAAAGGGGGGGGGDAARRAEAAKERSLAPQLDSGREPQQQQQQGASSSSSTLQISTDGNSFDGQQQQPPPSPPPPVNQEKNIAYLRRTLAETKRFRAELAHDPAHSERNAYPPIAMMYGKDTPTVYAAKVSGREGIPCLDAYDDLVFRAGDGVVLAKEAQVPPGYEVVNGGVVRTERGHLTMLGDMQAVGKALQAVIKGRRKGIGLGEDRKKVKAAAEAGEV